MTTQSETAQLVELIRRLQDEVDAHGERIKKLEAKAAQERHHVSNRLEEPS